MRTLIWIIRFVVLLLLVWFASKNAETVSLNGFLESSIKAPLVLILFAFFGGGLVLGLLASAGTVIRLRREVRKLNRSLQHAHHSGSHAVSVIPADKSKHENTA